MYGEFYFVPVTETLKPMTAEGLPGKILLPIFFGLAWGLLLALAWGSSGACLGSSTWGSLAFKILCAAIRVSSAEHFNML